MHSVIEFEQRNRWTRPTTGIPDSWHGNYFFEIHKSAWLEFYCQKIEKKKKNGKIGAVDGANLDTDILAAVRTVILGGKRWKMEEGEDWFDMENLVRSESRRNSLYLRVPAINQSFMILTRNRSAEDSRSMMLNCKCWCLRGVPKVTLKNRGSGRAWDSEDKSSWPFLSTRYQSRDIDAWSDWPIKLAARETRIGWG